jgi:nitroreductase
MDFLELAKKRYSARKYDEKKVEADKLEKILEAARVAPSGGNKQPVKLLVLQNAESIEKVAKATDAYAPAVFHAPLVIIACGDRNTAGVLPFNNKSVIDIDVSIATDHMMMEATSLGLGSVWIGAFDPVIISHEFNLPDYIEPINILAVGYIAGEPASPNRHENTRKTMSEILFFAEE